MLCFVMGKVSIISYVMLCYVMGKVSYFDMLCHVLLWERFRTFIFKNLDVDIAVLCYCRSLQQCLQFDCYTHEGD